MAPKVILSAVWILSLAAWLMPWTGIVASVVRWTGPLMAAAHVIEFVVYREVFEKAGGSTASHLLGTLIFGVFHINPLKEALEATPSGSDT